MQRDVKTPEEYLDAVEGKQKELLTAIRELIFEVEPEAEETINYGMLEYAGLANLAAQKNSVNLYVAPKALAEYKKKVPGADCGKSCLRFKSLKQFDRDAVKSLLELVRKIRAEGGDVGCCG